MKKTTGMKKARMTMTKPMRIKTDILSKNLEELQSKMSELGQASYRAGQVFEWLHRSQVSSFEQMSNLPKQLRSILDEHFFISRCRIVDVLISENDNTHKYLLELDDKALIESVRMEYKFGSSICISTQVGCRMGCKFCASAEGGLIRNLTAGEMCAQVYSALRYVPALTENNNIPFKLGGIVLMGCGEPFDNFSDVMRFLELIGHIKGANIGARHITISTCGLAPQIIEFARLQLQVNLAISLHSANDRTRQELLPIAKRYDIKELMSACRQYIKQTNRRITFEYSLIKGINDSPKDATDLAKLLGKMLCHVNLIPVNNGVGGYLPSTKKEIEVFAAILQENGIQTTIRRTIGSDVNAACGQLRSKRNSSPPKYIQ